MNNKTMIRPFNKRKTEFQQLQEMLHGKAPLVWVFTGDSITQGAKHTNGFRSYPEVFAERIRWEMARARDVVINTAVSGNTSANILQDADWRIAQFRPSVVLLMTGTNDCATDRLVAPAGFERNLQALVARVRQLKAIPLLQTPNIIRSEGPGAPERRALPEYIKIIRAVAERQSVILADHWEYWTAAAASQDVLAHWLKDPLHPNGTGHLQMARLLFRELEIFDPAAFTCSGKICESL